MIGGPFNQTHININHPQYRPITLKHASLDKKIPLEKLGQRIGGYTNTSIIDELNRSARHNEDQRTCDICTHRKKGSESKGSNGGMTPSIRVDARNLLYKWDESPTLKVTTRKSLICTMIGWLGFRCVLKLQGPSSKNEDRERLTLVII